MKNLNKNFSFIFLLMSAVMIFCVIYFIGSSIFKLKSYNFMASLTQAKATPSSEVVLIVVDDKSLSEVGRWPWPRTIYSEIFEYLENHTKAKVYGFDAIVGETNLDNTKNDEEFFNQVKKFKKLYAGVAFDTQDSLIDTNEQSLYANLLFSKSDIKIHDERSEKYKIPSAYKSFTKFPYKYLENIKFLGAVNVELDRDGYLRKSCQLIDFKGVLYPSLPLVMYSNYTGIKNFTLSDNYLVGNNEKYKLKMPVENRNGVVYSHLYFYTTEDGMYSHQKISASDVINSLRAIKKGKKPILDSSVFDNKIIFVGANANAQALQDRIRTPISSYFAGVDVQATNFNNLLENEFYQISSDLYNFLMVVMLFLTALILILMLDISSAFLSISFIMLLYFIFAYIMYFHRVAIDLILPEVFMLVALAVGFSYKFLLEGRKKAKLENVMSKYISKDVMQSVVRNIDSVTLGGKRANVTVLFADIRGFTTISEELSAEEVSVILNEYFSAIIPIIEKYNGILNKFVGDAVLAVFGEPIKDENHAVNAVKCANKMHQKVKQLQAKWLFEGKPKIEIGIGISTGEAFVGNIGSEERFEYTVIGDTVNIASRIENYNKIYKTKFLISQSTFELVQKYVDVIKIREVIIRGRAKRVNIYEVLRVIE